MYTIKVVGKEALIWKTTILRYIQQKLDHTVQR